MYKRFVRALTRLDRDQRGMTGLETSIILIAFVTVASVLAYSVLSAGIFSAERGKAAVYQGLDAASANLQLAGSVLGLSPNGTKLEQVQFTVILALDGATINMSSIILNYFDDTVHSENVAYTAVKNPRSVERGMANVLEFDEQFIVTATIPAAANIVAYSSFTLQVLPSTGAAIPIERIMPGGISAVMDLR